MTGNNKPLTTGDVARHCGVSRMGVLRWIRQGKLRAFSTPGGHYRIRVADFQDFLKEFDLPLDAAFCGAEAQRILVVTNDISDLGTIVRALSAMSEGYEIDIAPDATSAVARMAEYEPALVILGRMASWSDVLEVAQCIKENREGRRRPFLLLAMPTEGEAEERYVASSKGTAQSLVRQIPLNMETLQSTVRRLLTLWHE